MNKRINELEDHKKKLLQLLKQNNISPEATLFLIQKDPDPEQAE